jgi:hypothetical protein
MQEAVRFSSSGMLASKTSRWFLKKSTCSVFIVLTLSGKRLKSWAPFTHREFSLPLREPPDVKLTS